MFAAHGLADPLIDPGITAALVERYCSAATAVKTHWMPDVGHIGSSNEAAGAYLQWLDGLLGGERAPNDCGRPSPVPPAGSG